MNEYLASGLRRSSVNYRSVSLRSVLPRSSGPAGRGASEYKDIVAAGKYLKRHAMSILRASACGRQLWWLPHCACLRATPIFSAGVDSMAYTIGDRQLGRQKTFSPELTKLPTNLLGDSVETWKSPVLFIHEDDDRNVTLPNVDLVASFAPRA